MAINVKSVKVDFPLAAFLKETDEKMSAASAEMGVDILNRAIMNAPKASGALVRSGRVAKYGDTGATVTFGDNAVRYARKREYENKKNPHTIHYLEKAGESVVKGNIKKYFR